MKNTYLSVKILPQKRYSEDNGDISTGKLV